MTRVVDGVRRASAVASPVVSSQHRKAAQTLSQVSRQYVVGMDGVRRAASPAALPTTAVRAGRTPLAGIARLLKIPWKQPNLFFPNLVWKQRAGAVGLVGMALVASVIAVRVMAPPPTVTARAESVAAARLQFASASPTPTPAAVSITQQTTALQQLVTQFITSHQTDGKFNIVVKDLTTGATASYNPDQSYESASLYKLFVADQIYHLIDSGSLSYGAAAGGGSGNTIQGCLTLMITISDNTCGRALGSILNWGSQNPALAAEGFTETDLTTPQQTSARDVGLLLEDLYKGTLNTTASNTAFMNLLKDQKVNDRLPQGLPAGTVIAHKTGNLDNVVHDAGIVFGPKTNYLVVVMSGSWAEPGNAPPQFAQLSQQLWNFFEN